MKRKHTIQSYACTLALLLGASLGVSAATTLHLAPSGGAANASISVPLEIRSSDGVTALQFDLLYDPLVVELDLVRSGTAAAGHFLDFEIVSPGLTRVVVVSNTNSILQDGTVAEMDLTLLSEVVENTRSISFSNIILSDISGTDISIAWGPYVAITSPSDGSRFKATSNVGLTAMALDYDGTITSVQFFVGEQSVQLDTASPYTATWTATGAGEVILSAIAISSDGGQYTSQDVTIRIAPPPFNAWFASNFTSAEQANSQISGLTADPDGDMIPNLMEYALGLNPKQFNFDGFPEVGTVNMEEDSFATITYRANPEADDIDFTIEVSPDATTWQSGNGFTEELSSEIINGKRQVMVRDLYPVTSESQGNRLLRLTVRMTGF